MTNIIFILSKQNLLSNIVTTNNFNKFRLIEEFDNLKDKIYYNTFLIDSDAIISSTDWCIIANPYEGDRYVERCKKVTLENKKGIFYGMEGTRCLLIDATKIVGTTDPLLKEVIQIQVTEEMIKQYYSKPLNFMEEDLLE